MTSLGKRLHIRRGGGWVVRGGDACVALVPTGTKSFPMQHRLIPSLHSCRKVTYEPSSFKELLLLFSQALETIGYNAITSLVIFKKDSYGR